MNQQAWRDLFWASFLLMLVLLVLTVKGHAQGWEPPRRQMVCEWATDEQQCPEEASYRREPPARRERRQPPSPRAPRRWSPADQSPLDLRRERIETGTRGGVLTVHAVLCGVEAGAWLRRLGASSEEVRQAGGAGWRAGAILQGCPRTWSDLENYRARVRGGVIVAVRGDRWRLAPACQPKQDGCAQVGGDLAFLSTSGEDWDRTALTHEIGHLLGQEHSPDPQDVMFWRVSAQARVTPEYIRAERSWGQGSGNGVQGPPRVMGVTR